jgi:hypothetical protein
MQILTTFIGVLVSTLLMLPQAPLERQVGLHPSMGELRVDQGSNACEHFLAAAVAAGVPAGCEDDTVTNHEQRSRAGSAITGLPLGRAIDTIATAFPAYNAKILDGVLVVRPIPSWNDRKHFPHRSVGPATFGDDSGVLESIGVIHRLWSGHSPSLPDDPVMRARTVHVAFAGGTLLELLTEIVRADGALVWHVSYDEVRHTSNAFFLRFETFDGQGMGTQLGTRSHP